MKKNIRTFLFVVISFGIGFSIMYYLYQNYNAAYIEQCKIDGTPLAECSFSQQLIDDFKSVDLFWIGMVLICFTLSNISRALRWMMLLFPLGYKPKLSNSFFAVFITYFVNLIYSQDGRGNEGGCFCKI